MRALILALGFFVSSLASAQGGDAGVAKSAAALPEALRPKLTVKVAPTDVSVGDVVTLSITAVVQKGVDVNVPEQPLSPFEALDRRVTSTATPEGQRFDFALDLLALEPGQLTIPALRVRIVGAKGELGDVQTAPQQVVVKSPIANEPNAAPKPETKPTVVIEDDYTLVWVLGGIAAIALIAGATLLIQRWLKRRPRELPPPPPPRPAWEVAMEKLDQLSRKKAQLLSAERGEEFIAEVSATLREYLGRRYGFDGLESTSDEILKRLEQLRPHKLSLSGVALLLEQSDLVKFARVAPDEEQCDDLWNGAVGMVRATTPAPTPVVPEQPTVGAR